MDMFGNAFKRVKNFLAQSQKDINSPHHNNTAHSSGEARLQWGGGVQGLTCLQENSVYVCDHITTSTVGLIVVFR